MERDDHRRTQLDQLVHAIWGHGSRAPPPPVDPQQRELQNQALAAAIRAYLQSYLDETQAAPSDA